MARKANLGRRFLLKVRLGTALEGYTTVGGMRITSMMIDAQPVDITNKSSGGWRELLLNAAEAKVELMGEGLFAAADPGILLVEAANITKVFVDAAMISEDGDEFYGTWAIPVFKRSGADNDAELVSFSMASHGAVGPAQLNFTRQENSIYLVLLEEML